MGMVTLIQQQQQQQQTSDKNQEQDQNGACVVPVEDQHAVNRLQVTEVACTAREIVAPTNGSVAGSSTQCSDVEDDDNDEETDVEEGWIENLPVQSAIVQQQAVATTNGDLVLPNADPSSFGDVCVKNSTNVHLGNKTFYKGPVTIKQFVYTNPALVHDSSTNLSTNKSNGVTDVPVFPQNSELDKVTQWLWTWRCAALLCALVVILLATVVITTLYLTRNTDSPSSFTQPPPEIPDSSITGVNISSVRFVDRNEWGAQPPSGPMSVLKLPVPYVIISHTATDFCNTQSECTFRVRFAQTFHIESRNWSDIAYNFLVGGDGLAYVGRSWKYVGAHSFGFNDKSIGISFIGTFNTVSPKPEQLHAALKIIEIGVKTNKISPDYKLLAHRQVSKTLSPGDALYGIIKKWPHWSRTP